MMYLLQSLNYNVNLILCLVHDPVLIIYCCLTKSSLGSHLKHQNRLKFP